MSDLSRSLVDAAAEAMALINETSAAFQEPDARVAVAAALETLADGRMVMSDEFLRRLAAEVKETGGG